MRRSRVSLVGACTGLVVAVLTVAADVPPASRPVSAQTPADNPPIADQCGLPVTLVLDASGSISSSGAVETVRDAAEVFLDAVKDTGSRARVIDFGTFSRQTAPAVLVTTASMAPGGVHAQALADYYNPQPPVTAPATAARQYDGSGSLSSTANFGALDNTNVQWTNWDSALDRAKGNPGALVVFVTDGDPTALNLDQAGDAFNPPGTTVAFNTFRGSGTGPSVDRAVEEANAIKTGAGRARILAVGVGAAVTQPASVQRLTQIAGPQVVRDASGVTSLNQIDVAVVPDFDDLAALLKSVVTELCSPSLAIRKFVQTPDASGYQPAPGWDITVTPTVPGGTFNWVLPNTTPAASKTVTTDTDGFANFQWEPNPSTAASTATVSEAVEPGFTPASGVCEVLPPDSEAEFVDVELPTFEIDVGPQDIVTCTLRNNIDFNPGIQLVKDADPVLVRGDNGGTEVVYTGTITNTGDVPLVLSDGGDSNCADIEFVGGDTNGDGKLDLDETWTYQCTLTLQAGLTQDEILVDNTADVAGVDPNGEQVTDTDDAEVEVLVPAINLEKEPSATQVAPGTAVTYTFTVINLGNDPLSAITLTDDQCGTPTFVGGDTNGGGILDLDETWTYTCAAVIVNDPTINQATVTGTPTIGPPVTDPANAEVDVVFEDMNLDKTADPNVVLVGGEVTYTYVVSNPAADPLTPIAPTTRADLVTDDTCESVAFVGGDTGDDEVLSQGEEWTYTCTDTVTENTLNTGSATMQGPLGPITREDPALVITLPAGIQIIKTASEDLVRAGTDVAYRYEVSNTGLAPLAGVIPNGVVDDFCSAVTFVVGGDTNGNNLLDPGELFIFTCTATLTEDTTNTATATGTPVIDGQEGDPVTDDDPATVDVFTPGIELVKTVSDELVPVGTQVTYNYVATNTGDAPLVPLGVTDDQCAPLDFVGGDPQGDGRMAPGEAWTWECTDLAVADTVNTAVVQAVDPSGETVSDDDTAEVAVFTSEIVLEKTADPVLVPQGGTTRFTLSVTNPGSVPLSNITISDNVCSTVRFVRGDTNGDNRLAPNNRETWIYTCTTPIDRLTVNTAEVTGTDPGGGQPTDIGVAGALPYRPGIGVTKTATPTTVRAGGTVTYRYEVVNTGNIPLADVKDRIDDDTCSPVRYVSGDADGNELLTGDLAMFEISAETWSFSCTTTIPRTTTNTVVVEGVPSDLNGDALGPPVDGSDTATVNVTPVAQLPATGNRGLATPLTVATTLLLAGSAMVVVARRRRRSVV